MAEDGLRDEGIKKRADRQDGDADKTSAKGGRPDQAAKGGNGSGNAKPRAQQDTASPKRKPGGEIDLDATDPRDLPPYEDPQGRFIGPRHRRRAMREVAALGIEAADANHALHIAGQRGIDIFSGKPPSMLNIAARQEETAEDTRNLPARRDADDAKVPAKRQQPGKPVPVTEAERRKAINQIQRDLVRRRRSRFFALMLRLIMFVFLPTAAVGYYCYNVATEMYATESEFVIQTSEGMGGGGGLGGLLAGTGFATSQDSIVVQGYLTSREAFNRLNADFDYVEHFQDPSIDVIQRLPADATMDEAYAYYQDKVIIGYDPTEGIIRMTVIATTPEDSQKFAEALVGYAEERIDGLTLEARGDQLKVAQERYDEAEQEMLDAEQRVVDLQQQRGVLSAEAELTSQMSLINALELERENKRLALAELLDNARPNESRVEVARNEIKRLEDRIAQLRADLTETSDNSVSLARISGELRVAESALATRHKILQETIAAVEAARLEANRQTRYLSLGVAPVAPDQPTYPRKLENTVLAFFIFAGIYILASLTVSILREQMSV